MKKGYLVVIIIYIFASIYFYSPIHRESFINALNWWETWIDSAITKNYYSDERGLNVAIIDANGNFIESNYFDTYLSSDSGFPKYIENIPENYWVIIAANDEASNNLSIEDINALEYLGGSDILKGKYNWSYILVGYPNLGMGNGFELIDESSLEVFLTKGELIGGLSFPTNLTIFSYGYSGDSYGYACLIYDDIKFENIKYWLEAVIKRL